MSIAAAFGLIWRSSHILPRDAFNDLCECVDESQKAAVRAAPARRSGRRSPCRVSIECKWEMVVEVWWVEMTPDQLLRHVSYWGEWED